jgi:hypothetical protein
MVVRRWPGQSGPVAMLAVGLVGIALSVFGGYNTVKLARAARWAQTAGVVESSKVVDVEESSGDGMASVQRAEVTYVFRANGRQFESDALRVSGIGGQKHYFEPALAGRYPTGSAVRVAYDPDDPSDALLLPLQGGLRAHLEAVAGVIMVVWYATYLFRPRTGIWWQPRPRDGVEGPRLGGFKVVSPYGPLGKV